MKYPDMPFAMKTVPHSEELHVPSLQKIWLLAMTTLITMKITDSKKRTMLIAIRHLKQFFSHLNPIS